MHLSADVLLVTVNSHETQQLFEAFKEIHGAIPKSTRPKSRTYNDFGAINGMRVLHTLCEMGTSSLGSALQAIDESITDLQPHSVIMVGVAFGVNPEKQALGDVLVSRQLSLYEQVRVGAEVSIARGDKPHASAELVNYLNNTQLYWSEAKVRIGLVLSGEKLVDNSEFRDQLVAQEPEAIGGEMEGAGLYVTCQKKKVDWILVKGICDWADGNKSEDKDARQILAARNAARFVAIAFQLTPLQRVTSPFEQAAFSEPQSNLGESENAFIGRAALVSTVQAWATDQEAEWILCLHGPGGVGKTRLSKEAGRTLREQFDHIFLVNLESQSSDTVTPAYLAGVIAQVVKPKVVLEEPDKELAGMLAEEKFLLVLDNFDSADTVATQTWLKDFAQTGIKCLVTSRKRWTVRNAAKNVEVKRLEVPSSPTEDFDSIPAVQLFRARLDSEVTLPPYVTLSDSDRVALIRILQVTEGLPLAIEIIAVNLLYWDDTLEALVNDLGVKKIAYRKDLDESGGGPERHESMGACFQWSLDLLPEDERARFPKLGVFPYDFSQEAAQKICGVSPEDLHRWWQRSLVQRDTTTHSTRRFLLSLLRDYAQNQQSETVRKEVESRFVSYYAQLVKSCMQDGLLQINDEAVRARLDTEWRTTLVAHTMALLLSNFEDYIIIGEISNFLKIRGYFKEWEIILEGMRNNIHSFKEESSFPTGTIPRCLPRSPFGMPSTLSGVEVPKSSIREILRGLPRGVSFTPDKNLKDIIPSMENAILNNLGIVYRRQGRFYEALKCYQQSLEFHHLIGDSYGEGQVLGNMGVVYQCLDNYSAAADCYQKRLKISLDFEDSEGSSMASNNLGTLYLKMGILEKSIGYFQMSLQIKHENNDKYGECETLNNLGNALRGYNDFEKALNTHKEALLIADMLQDKFLQGITKINYALDLLAFERLPEALQKAREAVEILEQTQDRMALEEVLRILAQIEAVLGLSSDG